MPTAEGVFPKVGNDPIYYSEINQFASAGKFIAAGSFPVTSGTSYQSAGSVLIGAGSVSNPCLINVDWRVDTTEDSASARVNFSGLSTYFVIGSSTLTSDPYGTVRAMLGSPFGGAITGITKGNTTVSLSQSSDHFNTGSLFYVIFETLSQNSCQMYYMVNAGGRGY
jgi:hypothetical protein